jgi:hypothetical protein
VQPSVVKGNPPVQPKPQAAAVGFTFPGQQRRVEIVIPPSCPLKLVPLLPSGHVCSSSVK